ncbi:MAG TPA: carbohydrate ABC transporter permease [Thermomicrobiales bacterium]|nr:carbohydrate ABC transporter permease [Thermomicrobiales bacterium]
MRVSFRWTGLLRHLVLIAGAGIMLLPFLYMVGTSFKPHAFVMELPPTFIPTNPTLDNYIDAFTSNRFGLYFLNSAIVATSSTVVTVLLSALLAYAFARFEFPGRSLLYYLMLGTLMVPSLVLLIPQFVLARDLHLLDSRLGLIVVYSAAAPFNMLLLRGFFEEIPQDLLDASMMDGSGPFQTFWHIALPLAKPALAAVSIFAFLGSWDEFTWAFTAITDQAKYTLPIAIRLFQQQHGTQWGLVFAASTIAVLPTILVFILFQRHFIRGVMSGAVKG